MWYSTHFKAPWFDGVGEIPNKLGIRARAYFMVVLKKIRSLLAPAFDLGGGYWGQKKSAQPVRAGRWALGINE